MPQLLLKQNKYLHIFISEENSLILSFISYDLVSRYIIHNFSFFLYQNTVSNKMCQRFLIKKRIR
jgi:hypothetical protein